MKVSYIESRSALFNLVDYSSSIFSPKWFNISLKSRNCNSIAILYGKNQIYLLRINSGIVNFASNITYYRPSIPI
jgi:hypothetical protein